MILYSYSDSNYAEDVMNWRLTMKYVFMLNSDVIAWMSKKQCTVSTSITEAEYIALEYNARQSI